MTTDHEDAVHEAESHHFAQLYAPLSLSEITSGKIIPPPWLLGPSNPLEDMGLLRSKTITMVSAEPFTGKTMLMLGVTLGLASGRGALGYPAAPGHRVLFLGQDAPTWDYWGQVRKLWLGLGQPAIPQGSAFFFLNRGWKINDPGFDGFLTETIRLYGITVLILDTLLQFHDAEENSNKEMRVVMDLLKSWRDKGLTIIFSHHTGKTQGISGNYAARGASVISGSVDFHLQLGSRGNVISLGLPKRRGGAKRQADGFSITDSAGGIVLEPRARVQGPSELVLEYLTQPRTMRDLMTFLGSHFPGDTYQVTGRLHGVLGRLKRLKRITEHPDGTFVAVSTNTPKP